MTAAVQSPAALAAEIVYTVDPEALTAYALALEFLRGFDAAAKSREKIARAAAAILEHRGRPDVARALLSVHRRNPGLRTGAGITRTAPQSDYSDENRAAVAAWLARNGGAGS